MTDKNALQGFEDGLTASRAWLMDLPLAGLRWGMGFGSRQETAQAAWSGYDASVGLAKNAIDTLYRNPAFADWAANGLEVTLDGLLRWQQVGNAMTRTLLAATVQAADLPTRQDVAALRAEVAALRNRLDEVAATDAVENETRGEPAKPREPVVTPLAGPVPTRRAA